jgi:hypothetical protein
MIMSDPLAQYRKKPIGRTEAAPAEEGGYAAFGTKDKVERLRIRRASAPTRSPGYAYLLDVVYDGSYGTNFVLVYTFLMVMVRGKNLQPLIMALELGTADFLQEFDPEKWEKPASDVPFIESIEVVVQESGPSISNTEEIGQTVH